MPDNKSLPVKGYSDQSDEKVALVNGNKELEERVLRVIDHLDDMVSFDIDEEDLAFARAQIQNGFMWLNRAIFQPERISLPEDEEGGNDAS